MSLRAELHLRVGALDLDLPLTAEPGESVALLGPNGAGKSTALRLLAGLEGLDAGRISLDGDVLDEPATGRWVAPEDRRIGMVFQDYALFDHLDATENVAFGLRARGVRRAEARSRAVGWLERMGLGALADHRPGELSGGQRQRVALARALVVEPRLLLLDEPLAALDVGTRAGVRRELRRHLEGFGGVRVLVTHDPVDARVLADRVVVLEAGRVVQEGPLDELSARPRSDYVARLVGANLLSGEVADGVLHTATGGLVVVTGDVEGPALASIPPAAVALHPRPPEGSPRNCWPVRVADVEVHGGTATVHLDGPVHLEAEITTAALSELGLRADTTVWAAVKATEIAVYPA